MKPWPVKGIRRSFWLPPALLAALKETAERRRISQNEVVRQAIASYLGDEGSITDLADEEGLNYFNRYIAGDR